MFIIVSAFISKVNQQKSIEKYIDYGNKLLAAKINDLKIVFLERAIYKTYYGRDIHVTYPFIYAGKTYDFTIENNTIFVMFEKHDNYLYNYADKLTAFAVNTDNPTKDTIDYMFVQCHKTEWLHMAIHLTQHIAQERILTIATKPHFMWLDFGIYHIFKKDDLFYAALAQLNTKQTPTNNKVRMGSCIHPRNTYHTDIYRTIAWYFAGGVFGGSSEAITQLAERMKIECIHIIEERKHLMWEVNVWYLIYLNHPDLFDPYLCDHNPSILLNY